MESSILYPGTSVPPINNRERKSMYVEAKIEELQAKLDLKKLESIKDYTLSDAIREGSSVTDQATHRFFSGDGQEACALQAALIAARARGMI